MKEFLSDKLRNIAVVGHGQTGKTSLVSAILFNTGMVNRLGKVDQGGGGTIAYILAEYDMEVIDSGIAVLNMHAPWEVISKVDVYEALRGYIAFLKEAK